MRHWRVPIALLAAYLLAISCAGLRDKMVLEPSTRPITVVGAESVQFKRSDGGVTDAFIADSPGCHDHKPDAFVLDFTGNGTRAELIAAAIAQRWQNRPVEAVTVNYPGYGGSTGPASMSSMPAMELDAFDDVKKLAGTKPVIVTGHSLGCTAALYVAAHRPVAGLVLQNPPPLKQLIIGRFGWWNLWLGAIPIALQIPHNLDSIANARMCHEPAVLISSIHDNYVPPKYHRMVFSAYAGPHFSLALDGGHNTAPDRSAEFPAALDWLWQQIGLPAPAPSTSPAPSPTHEFAG
jgi:predicted alpha/beta hydrolase family esterase